MESSPAKSRLSFRQLALLLVVALGLGALVGYLTLSGQPLSDLARNVFNRIGLAKSDTEIPGQWGLYEAPLDESQLSPEQRLEMRRLRSLGYAGGTVPAHSSSGVTQHDPDTASKGLRYFTSGHEPGAYLMEPDGRIVHSWHLSYDQFIRDSGLPPEDFLPDPNGVTACWRRAFLQPDGGLLVIFEGHGLARIDRDSRLVWAYPGPCHHDLEVAGDGSIHVLTREPRMVPDIHPDKPVLVDYITRLTPTGEPLGALNLLDAFRQSEFASYLENLPDGGDIFHTNTLEILDGRAADLSPVFREGNYLISLRETDVIAIVDSRTEKVVWALKGPWRAQHQPTLLEDGNILLFDNQGHAGRSKVIEIDPSTQEVVWAFEDNPTHPLYSKTCGSCQRLPGGNTLITESDNGRALEVNRQGKIVWEFRNPERAGKDREFIAAIMEMVILPEDYRPTWLSEPQ